VCSVGMKNWEGASIQGPIHSKSIAPGGTPREEEEGGRIIARNGKLAALREEER